MKPVAYLIGAVAIVGSLSGIALALRSDIDPSPRPAVVKAELAPRPVAPPAPEHVQPLPAPSQSLPTAQLRATAPAPAETVADIAGDPLDTMGRTLAADRAESLARLPALKRSKGRLQARKRLRAKVAKKKKK